MTKRKYIRFICYTDDYNFTECSCWKSVFAWFQKIKHGIVYGLPVGDKASCYECIMSK